MALFDLFKGKSTNDVKRNVISGKNVSRLGRTVGDRLAQTYDRRDAISSLASAQTNEAVSMLLKRFTFHVDPSTDDQEEKEAAFSAIVSYGKDAVEPKVLLGL